jgi:hypothetical protein
MCYKKPLSINILYQNLKWLTFIINKDNKVLNYKLLKNIEINIFLSNLYKNFLLIF